MPIERAPDIERLVDESRRAFRAGDVDALARMSSRHPAALVVGSDPREIRRGYDQIVGALRADLEETARSETKLLPGEVAAWNDGDLGWAISFSAFRLADGTEIPTRAMSVLNREDGEWKFLQGMFSLGVPNSALQVGSPLARAFSSAVS